MKEIYILRHGETEQNLQGIVQGSGIDSSLNSTGRLQAQKFYNYYKSTEFDLFITSNLNRTYQTINHFIFDPIPHIKDPRIREISWGEHEGKASEPELMQKYYRIINEWKSGNLDARPKQGESALELQDRLKSFLTELESRPFKRALVCSHGRTLRALICLLKNWPLTRMEEIGHNNTGLYIGQFNGSKWTVHSENNLQHLAE
ncbi:MAG: histidine phosphatase family protein [Saprospiraceae bacterium]